MIKDKIKSKKYYDSKLKPSYVGKTLNIEITTGCNEQCIYCYHEMKGTHTCRKEIDEQLFYRVTKEAYELGITDVGLYMAGEPLLNSKVYDYIKYLKNIGFTYVYISTNGLLCIPENLEKLVDAGVDSIKFSIAAATKDNFIKHHGVDGFELFCNNVRYAYEYRKLHEYNYSLYAFAIITKYNQHEKEKMNELFGKYVDEIVFTNVLDHMVPIKGFREYLMLDEDKNKVNARRQIPCSLAFNTVAIDEDGFLHVCCSSNRESTKIADLNELSLEDALYSDAFLDFRRRQLEKNIKGTYCEICCGNSSIDEVDMLLPELKGKKEVIKRLDATEEIKKRFC